MPKKFGEWYRSRNKDAGTGIRKQMKYGSIYAMCRKWQRRTRNKQKTQSSLLIKVNNRNNRTRCEICSKLTIKTAERRQWMKYDINRLPSLAKPYTWKFYQKKLKTCRFIKKLRHFIRLFPP